MCLEDLGSFIHGWLQDAISNTVNVSSLLTHTFEIINWKFFMPKSWNNKIKLSQSDDISLVQEISFHMWEDNPTFFNVCSCLFPLPSSPPNCLLIKFHLEVNLGKTVVILNTTLKPISGFTVCKGSVHERAAQEQPAQSCCLRSFCLVQWFPSKLSTPQNHSL